MEKRALIKKIILIAIGALLLTAVIVAIRYIAAYNGFLDKITAREPEMKQYSVIVLNDSEIKEVGDLAGLNVGFLKTDPKAANAGQKLSKVVEAEINYYDDIDILTEALANNITSAIVLESERLDMLKEDSSAFGEIDDDGAEVETGTEVEVGTGVAEDGVETESVGNFFDNVRVIYSFSIELDGEDMNIPDKQITKEPFVLYISGSDSRTGIKTVARSDVNILVVVNPEQSKILLVSIPRDTYVQLHDTVGLKDKLTHAGVYGINMSKTTIEDFLGVGIDYTLKVSFDTVIEVVDQLDGIDIESDKEMTLKSKGGEVCDFIVGKQHVNGVCALRFARERKSYETGDRHRGENQQQVIISIIGRLSNSKDYVLKIPNILDIAADSFETTIPRDSVSDFIRMQLLDGPKWKVESISVDGTGTYEPTYSMGANRPLYVMIPNEDTVMNARNKIYEYLGEPLPVIDTEEVNAVDNAENVDNVENE